MDTTDIFGAKDISQIGRNGCKTTAIHREDDHGCGIEHDKPCHSRIDADLFCGKRDRHIENDAQNEEAVIGVLAPDIVRH